MKSFVNMSVIVMSCTANAAILPPNTSGEVFHSGFEQAHLLLQDGVKTIGTSIIFDKMPPSPKGSHFVNLYVQLKPSYVLSGDPLHVGISLPDESDHREGEFVADFSSRWNGEISSLLSNNCEKYEPKGVRCSLGGIDIVEGRRYDIFTQMTPSSPEKIVIKNTVMILDGNINLGEYTIGEFSVIVPKSKDAKFANPFVSIGERFSENATPCNEVNDAVEAVVRLSELFILDELIDISQRTLPLDKEAMGSKCGAEVEISTDGYSTIRYGRV
ncbi:hypothetical protein RA180_09670 [Aeromonas salmonicida]|uniref:hypothetical protein n=1 Tax=Aeromonas salmonicida TaxID=645 RepID=UPI00279655D8|nr:hypothetical protein [Aeromonas salmonicida]MDQ1884259.1 hypothetical protein [Aeromonas salmonicida]